MILGSAQLGSIQAQLGALAQSAVVVGPGDMVTTENAYFRRSATTWNGEFARGVTGADATFRRTVTTADAER